MIGCGCKICKNDLGEFTNELILSGESPKSVLAELEKKGLTVSKKLLKKHLAAFEIDYPHENSISDQICEPVTIELNDIDFTQYDFDINQVESIIAYLQKLNLKVYLNQLQITLQAQQNVIDGKAPGVPSEVFKNLAIACEILEKSTGMRVMVNQQQAIKTVEAMGLTIQNQALLPPKNVQANSDTETN